MSQVSWLLELNLRETALVTNGRLELIDLSHLFAQVLLHPRQSSLVFNIVASARQADDILLGKLALWFLQRT